jgi:hypothetical protein
MPSDFLFTVFFEDELLAAVDLAVDFSADLEDLLEDVDFELAPDDLLDATFEPDPDLPFDDFDAELADFPAVDFSAEDDLPADDFVAVFEPEDLPADFDADVLAAGLTEDDLLPLAEEALLAVVSLLVADSAEFFLVVAIAISLKFF